MKKRVGVFVVALVSVMIACAGCNAVNIDTAAQDDIAVRVFDAIENEQYDSVGDYFYAAVKEDGGFYDALATISEYIEGTAINCTKTGFYYNTSVNNGQQTNTLQLAYNIETAHDRYAVNMNLVQTGETTWKIYGYNVIRAEELRGNGAIINFEKFDIAQLLLLIYSAACIGLVIFSIVLCAKAKIRLKALWIIIILCQAGFALTRTAHSFNFSLQVIAVTISSLRKFVNGDTVLTVLIPLGAILFLCLRKTLIRSAAEYERRKAMSKMPPPPMPAPMPVDAPAPEAGPAAPEDAAPRPDDGKADERPSDDKPDIQ